MKFLIMTFTLLVNCLLGALDPDTMTEEQIIETLQKLDWKEGTLHLPLSHSSIELPQGYQALMGNDINILHNIMREPEDDTIEAVIYSCDEKDCDFVDFSSTNDGYITLDDWKDIDSKELLKSIIENTKIANKKRLELGGNPIEVLGWVQEPTLDAKTNTVYWTIELTDDRDQKFVNSIALKLGRNGYEHINWVTSIENFVPFGGKLDEMLKAHSFDPGFRYTDHVDTDRIANYGIAALVAAMAGGKLAKAGSLVAILAMLKKFGTLIITAAAGLTYKFRGLFKRYQS